jgi:predicted 2-oxoglutarate/Fe(II)-dependent dioxygenase YbiX
MHDAAPTATSELPHTIPGFLAPDECRAIVGEIDAAFQEEAKIWLGQDFGVDRKSRSGTVATLATATEELVQDRLWSVMAELEERYRCEVSHVSGVTALVYRRGDHFSAHSDGGVDGDAPPEVTRRRVSLVVALNDGAGAQPDFTGGELHFYPSSPPGVEPAPEDHVAVCSRPGLLIAFPSPMVHRVTPVAGGCRYSLAMWALAPDGST